ncbi:MAG TPA: ferrochelatase [Prolixibacteraceae bacterium]|nr:ferrochelatase [Prolixibacteraceae bacterium]
MTKKTAVILANVGTPDAPTVPAVRKYLFEFLNDRRVIDLPWLLQKILVNLIIVPFRAPKSTKLYQKLWTEKGSPLLVISNETRDKLQEKLGENFTVFVRMRYQNPSLKAALKIIQEKRFDEIVVLPMFPQYASSTTGTIVQLVNSEMAKWNVIPEISIISQFYDNPGFIKAFAAQISKYNPASYDHIIFSYHGLPFSQTDRVHPEIKTAGCQCETGLPAHGNFCYKATCYETTRLLAKELGLPKSAYSVAFQSRLTKNWLNPFSDEEVIRLAKEGKKRILIAAPAFIADCLETIVEIGIEYQEIFAEHGGEKVQLVESLNANNDWIETIYQMITNKH